MIIEPEDGAWPAPPVFPPRHTAGAPASAIETYLAALGDSLAGQIDTALEADGIITPLGAVARATLVEAIGGDLETAVRDLMLAGFPREQAEAKAIADLGPASLLGRDLLVVRRRRAAEDWRRRESVWWWVEPLMPVAAAVLAVFVAAAAPTVAIIAGMVAEPRLGTLAVGLVPLVAGLMAWAAGSMAPNIGGDPPK